MSYYRVLISEDDEDDCFILATIFDELYGDLIELTCLNDLEECKRFLTLHPMPDLVILDFHQPPTSALDFLTWLSVQSHLQYSKTIVWSAKASSVELSACFQAGAAGFIKKEFDYKNMKRLVEQTVNEWLIMA